MSAIPTLSQTRDNTMIPRITARSEEPVTPAPKLKIKITLRESVLLLECIEEHIFQLKKRSTELSNSHHFEELSDIRDKIDELIDLSDTIVAAE